MNLDYFEELIFHFDQIDDLVKFDGMVQISLVLVLRHRMNSMNEQMFSSFVEIVDEFYNLAMMVRKCLYWKKFCVSVHLEIIPIKKYLFIELLTD